MCLDCLISALGCLISALTALSLLGLSYHEVEEGEVVLVAEPQEVPAREERVRPCKEKIRQSRPEIRQPMPEIRLSRPEIRQSVEEGDVVLVAEAQEMPAREQRVRPFGIRKAALLRRDQTVVIMGASKS